VTLRLNVVVLAMGLFVALGVVGGLVGHRLGVSAHTESAGPQGGSTSTTPTASTSASAPGLFYARGLEIHDDGTWSFNDPLGYDEAVTIARTYEVVYASPASIGAIKNDRDASNKAHHNSGDYPGMSTLPADAKVLATFRQPPGRYKGKGSPCKNT
jgi:hypothetical protein